MILVLASYQEHAKWLLIMSKVFVLKVLPTFLTRIYKSLSWLNIWILKDALSLIEGLIFNPPLQP